MKKALLIFTLGVLSAASSFAATLQPNAIIATSVENLEKASVFVAHHDEAGLEEMDREGKINTFKIPLEVTVHQRSFLWVSFSFPGKTDVLYTATEMVKD